LPYPPARRIQLLPNFNSLLQTRKLNGLSLQSCRRETPKPRTDGPRPPLARTLEFSHGELGARLVHPALRRVRACPAHGHGPPRARPLVVVYRHRVSIRERRTCQDGWGPPDTGLGLFGHVDLTRSPGQRTSSVLQNIVFVINPRDAIHNSKGKPLENTPCDR
jgi:hypothetical protein